MYHSLYQPLTLVGTVGMSLITVVPTVIVAITGPMHRDAASTVAFELVARAGMAATGFVTVVSAVIVCRQEEKKVVRKS